MRAGERTWDELALRAYTGEPAALRALDEPANPVVLASDDDVNLWLRGFAAWGREVLAEALLTWLRTGAGSEAQWSPGFLRFQHAIEPWRSPGASELGDPEFMELNAARDPQVMAALFSRLVIRAYHDEDREHHEPLLEEIDHFLGGGFSPRLGLGLPAEVRASVLHSCTPRLEHSLPEGPTLGQRVVDATTSPLRRRVVSALRGAVERRVRLVGGPWDGRIVEVAGRSGFDRFEGFPEHGPGLFLIGLGGIEDVLPA